MKIGSFSNRGKYSRYNKKTEQEDVNRLTVKAFREAGVFKRYQKKLSFSIGAESFEIELATTHPHYGGVRYWFKCPVCEKRCAVLYFCSSGIKCRTCARLSYASQNEDKSMRAARKARQIIERLGGENILCEPVRPKGMHFQTYDRLLFKFALALKEIF